MKNGKIRRQKATWRRQNSKIPKNSTNVIFQQFLTYLSSTSTIFWYLWVLTPPSGLLWPYFAVFHGITLKCTWGSLLGHNQGWKSNFRNIHLPYCNFRILLSSGLLVAFLVLEFKLKMFFNLLGPNDLKKVKKIWKCHTIVFLAFDLAFMTFMAFFGLYMSFRGSLMSNKSIRFIFSWYF